MLKRYVSLKFSSVCRPAWNTVLRDVDRLDVHVVGEHSVRQCGALRTGHAATRLADVDDLRLQEEGFHLTRCELGARERITLSGDGESRSEERETEGHDWRATESIHGTPPLDDVERLDSTRRRRRAPVSAR